ncbi:MAG: S8 family serine peptidase [Leptospiraceae bacterium]|nr:S8 family serine peptidase [Leptospiraceae bacterium]
MQPRPQSGPGRLLVPLLCITLFACENSDDVNPWLAAILLLQAPSNGLINNCNQAADQNRSDPGVSFSDYRMRIQSNAENQYVLLESSKGNLESIVAQYPRLQADQKNGNIQSIGHFTKADSQIIRVRSDLTAALTRSRSGSNQTWRYLQPDYAYTIAVAPNDPDYTRQWGHKNTGQTVAGQTGISGIDSKVEEAWSVRTGCIEAVVAVIDTGIDLTHIDLAANLWTNTGEIPGNGIDDDANGYVDDIHGWDFVKNDSDPTDEHGHGTHVAGIIGGVGNNASGVSGVCQSARIMPVRALGETGIGFTSSIVQAIDYAIQNHANVINLSLSGLEGSDGDLLYQAIDRARTNNILVIAAAGNSHKNNDLESVYPASYNLANIIAVAAVDNSGNLASFSNYGSTTVDIAAPGSNIYSTWPYSTSGQISDTYINNPEQWQAAGTPGMWLIETMNDSGRYCVLSDPSGDAAEYGPGWNTTAYTTVPAQSAAAVHYRFDMKLNVHSPTDSMAIVAGTEGQIPDSLFLRFSGDYFGQSGWVTISSAFTNPYVGKHTPFGFQLLSDSANQANGLSVRNLNIKLYSNSDSSFLNASGTSMAAPYVAAAATLLQAHNVANSRGCSMLDIKAKILGHSTSLASLAGLIGSGRMLNVKDALDNLTCP